MLLPCGDVNHAIYRVRPERLNIKVIKTEASEQLKNLCWHTRVRSFLSFCHVFRLFVLKLSYVWAPWNQNNTEGWSKVDHQLKGRRNDRVYYVKENLIICLYSHCHVQLATVLWTRNSVTFNLDARCVKNKQLDSADEPRIGVQLSTTVRGNLR